MEEKSSYTIKKLLEELKEKMPPLEEGQIFETLKPIYPDESQKNKNLSIDNRTFTKPLAVSKKDKRRFEREKSPLIHFYKGKKRGDLLKVVKVENDEAKCINLSLREEVKDKYYKDEFVTISYRDIIEGIVKQIKRNINKAIEEQEK